MSSSLAVLLPIAGVAVAGYAAGRARVLPEKSSATLNAFVYWIALPAIMFIAMANTTIQLDDVRFAAAFALPLLAASAVCMLMARRANGSWPDACLAGINASSPNTAYLGLPIVLGVLGETALGAGAITIVLSALSVMAAIAILEVRASREHVGGANRPVTATLSLLRTPLLVAPAIGAAFAFGGLQVVAPLAATLRLLGNAATPCAVFALGLFIAEQRITIPTAATAVTVAIKLLVVPGVVWAAAHLLSLGAKPTAVAVLQAGMPTSMTTFVIANRYGTSESDTMHVIVVSSILSMITIPIWLNVTVFH